MTKLNAVLMYHKEDKPPVELIDFELSRRLIPELLQVLKKGEYVSVKLSQVERHRSLYLDQNEMELIYTLDIEPTKVVYMAEPMPDYSRMSPKRLAWSALDEIKSRIKYHLKWWRPWRWLMGRKQYYSYRLSLFEKKHFGRSFSKTSCP